MASTTLFPVASLPSCVANCGPLYDVNGKCVPPNVAAAADSVYDACFCSDSRLTAFSSTTAGVCDSACTATPADLGTIQGWYSSFCLSVNGAAVETTTGSSSSSTSSGSTSNNNSGGGGTWLSTHYQWVIFLVIMVVAIVGIWVGACVWRRHYLRKKDRQYALGRNLARATESGRIVPNASQAGSIHVPAAGMFMPAPITSAGVYGEKQAKKEKKKWVVSQRT